MPSLVPAALSAYRADAASRFAQHTRNRAQTPPPPSVTPHIRRLFPSLQAYLTLAAARFRASKSLPRPSALPTPRAAPPARALGAGAALPAAARALLAPRRRAEQWAAARAVAAHAARARAVVVAAAKALDVVAACAIPRDVRARWAATWAAARADERARAEGCAEKVREGRKVGKVEGGALELLGGGRGDVRGFAQYVERCEEVLSKGESALGRVNGACAREVAADSFEEVRLRYAGRPDELYRRKTARRFATWRRERREREKELVRAEASAEREMKKRRGHDHLLTGRVAGDSSFAPFLFQLDSNAYAYSSKITEAPKLRKAMIEKYATKGEDGGKEMNAWEKAHQAAEINPLFHTRVMNRFT